MPSLELILLFLVNYARYQRHQPRRSLRLAAAFDDETD